MEIKYLKLWLLNLLDSSETEQLANWKEEEYLRGMDLEPDKFEDLT